MSPFIRRFRSPAGMLIALLFLLLLPDPVIASDIEGTVFTSGGARLANATVKLVDPNNNNIVYYQTTTDGSGNYHFYLSEFQINTRLKFEKSGYAFGQPGSFNVMYYEYYTWYIYADSGPAPTLAQPSNAAGYPDTDTLVDLSGIGKGDNDIAGGMAIDARSDDPAKVTVADVSYLFPATTGTIRLRPGNAPGGSTTIRVIAVRTADGQRIERTLTYTFNSLDLPPSPGVATALDLNGSNQYAEAPAGGWFGNTYTVEGWVWVNSFTTWSRFFDFGNGAGDNNVLVALTEGLTGKPVFSTHVGGVETRLTSSNVLPMITWTHLAVTRDTSGIGRMYMNGVLVASGAIPAPASVTRTKNYIGRSNWSADGYADARFADIRVWNVARTAQELSANKSLPISPGTANLVANYRFNETWGNTAKDLAVSSANPDQWGVQNLNLVNGATLLGPSSVLGRYVRNFGNSWITIPNLTSLFSSSQPMTIEFWHMQNAPTNADSALFLGNGNQRINVHLPWSDGSVYWDYGDFSAGGRLSYPPPTSLYKRWNHFAFVVSPGSGGFMRIYRNGVLEASKSGASTLSLPNVMALDLKGAGSMADFRIWRSVRTADQIAGNRFKPVPANSTDLIVNFPFNETSGVFATNAVTAYSGQYGGLINAPFFSAAMLAALDSSYNVPTVEDSSRLVYLPATDNESAVTYSNASAANGSLSQLSTGHYLYNPNPNISGADRITYTVSDGSQTRNGGLNVQVSAYNDPPVVGPGTSLAFDGVDDRVSLTNLGTISGSFTVEAWVRPDHATATMAVMGSRTPGEASFDFKFVNGTRIHGDIGTGSGWLTTSADAFFNYTPGTWYHVAYAVTPTEYKIYVDGVPLVTNSISGGTPLLCDASHILQLGNYGAGEPFNGRIGTVRIWNTVLPASSIQLNRHASLPDNAANLVAQYRMNEGSGNGIVDTATGIGTGVQNGSLVGGPVWQPFDGPERAVTFNGNNQYGQVLDSAPVSITGPITVEAWVRPESIGQIMGVVEKYGVNDGGYVLRIDNTGKVRAYILDKESDNSTVLGGSVLPAKVWSHIAMRWDGNLLQVFVNGRLDGTEVVARNPKDGASALMIGATGVGGLRFNGRIGDVRLWNVARSDTEIASFRGGVAATTPGLVLNYRFTEGSGTTLTDLATGDGAQSAALQNSPVWPAAETTLAVRQTVTFVEDVALNIALPAYDIEGATLTYSGISATSGTLTLVSGNQYTYRPGTNYNGAATITYTVSDGATPVTSKIYLQGAQVEDPPYIATIANQTVGEGSALRSLSITLNDGDPEQTQAMTLTAASSNPDIIRNPGVIYNGTAENAEITYKPRPGTNGTVTITLVATETQSRLSYTNTFNIIVTPVDDIPNVGPATALMLNRSNYVEIPEFGANLPTDELTVEFWQFVNLQTNSTTFALMPDIFDNRLIAHVPWESGEVIFDLGNAGAGGRLFYRPPVPIVNTWQHFAFVASRSGNYMKIFRNGVEEATKPGVSATFVPGNRALRLGSFDGQMAEFRVWKTARTAEQITAAMHSSQRHDDTNLVAYYRFNQQPTLLVTDFASAANQGGAQHGFLKGDGDNDPIWQVGSGAARPWQTSVPALNALQIVKVPAGSNSAVYLPAWDAENGIGLTWSDVIASTGSVQQVSGGLWTYSAPTGHNGPATISYNVRDSSVTNPVVGGTINLRVVVAQNDAPTIASIPNTTAEENSSIIEIPFYVDDDQPPSDLKITPVLFENSAYIQSVNIPAGENFRTLQVVPVAGEIGTVHIRLFVQDAGGKTAQTEFDLRIEPKPAYSAVDLGVLGGKAVSFGTAINDTGAVVGYMADTADRESNPVGFFFNGIENGGVVENNPPAAMGPAPLSSPFRIWTLNNSYTMAGAGVLGNSTVGWFKNLQGDMVNYPPLSGGGFAESRAINVSGVIAGWSSNSAGFKRAVRIASGDLALTDLGLGPAPFNVQSEAFGINAAGDIVGAIYNSAGQKRAMIRQDNTMLPLFSAPNDTNSVAYSINAFDQVVGSSSTFAAGDSALSFDKTNSYVIRNNLLNTNGASLVVANAPHTVEAWIRNDASPTVRTWPLLLGQSGSGAHHWTAPSDSNGKYQIGIWNGNSVMVPYQVGAWMHIAAVYDNLASKLTVYVNGQPFATNSESSVNLQTHQLVLGQAQNNEANFRGALDEVRVWNKTRTAAQIAANYTRRLEGNEDGLVVYYPFDEGTGTTTTSVADGHLVATLTNSPTWTVRAGLPSPDVTLGEAALQFDGTSSRVVAPAVPLANASFTVEFLARRAEINRAGDIVVGMGTSSQSSGLHVGFRTENNFTFAFWNDDLNTPAYTDTDLHHWAATYNSTNKLQKIYRDGVLVAQRIASGNFTGTGPLIIGGTPWNDRFKGTVDDVRVWNFARSDAEISANQYQRFPATTPGLLANYLFDEGGGNVTANRGGAGGSASLEGAISWSGRDTGSKRAFFYDLVSGRLTSLGTVTDGGDSEAYAINDFGQTVGSAVKLPGRRAFFYSAGKLNDLNDLLPEVDQLDQWSLESARGINRSGAIVGTGTHRGVKRAFIALPATIIGRPVIRPQGAVVRKPLVTILKNHLPDDTSENSFYWSESEKKLYGIRPVTAKIEWFTQMGNSSSLDGDTNRIVSVTVNVWPKEPTIHVAGAPVDMQPAVTAANYSFISLIYVTNTAAVEPSSKVFTSATPGYTVAFYLKNDGQQPNPENQKPYFEVVRTVTYTDSHAKLASYDWTIGTEVTESGHREYNDKNGYVLLEKAAYDAAGADRAYDRGTRLGPILPVNVEKPGNNSTINPDPLVVVWYRTNRIGVAWASVPARYSLKWPADDVAEKIIIASQLGSGLLSAANYPAKTIYNQPDKTLPGFNPNEEHAYMPDNVLYALRYDLNPVERYSEPFALLKYRDPSTARWKMRVFKVVGEQAPYFFTYSGTAGKEIQPPLPLSLMPLSADSRIQPVNSEVGWEDYKGKIYARMAGPEGANTNLMVRWYYPMQPGFFHPDTNIAVGTSLAWLDRRGTNTLTGVNAGQGIVNTPIDVTYDIRWDDHFVLQTGETLLHSRRGLPDVYNMANARVIFDSSSPGDPASSLALARFYDPISTRTIKTGVSIPTSLKRQNIGGKVYFTDLPWFLKIRLSYDPINNWLSFSGYLDENFGVGEPLLLPNVLTDRERQRITDLVENDGTWASLITRLYNLTRNPNEVDVDPVDLTVDVGLRLGLTTLSTTNFFTIYGQKKEIYQPPDYYYLTNTGGFIPEQVWVIPPPVITWRDISYTPTSLQKALELDQRLRAEVAEDSFRPSITPLQSSYSVARRVLPEPLGGGPKSLTAGFGGVPAAQPRPGNALSFNGTTNALVTVGTLDSQHLDLTATPFTVEFWAKANTFASDGYIVGQPSGAANFGRLRIGFRDGGRFAFDLGTTPATDSIFNTGDTYADTNWHHWACSFNPETKIQLIYRDGAVVANRTNSALAYSGFGVMELGRFGLQHFNGLLDEVRVWKTARSASQIRSQMHKRLLGVQSSAPLGAGTELGLVLLYRCDESSGTLQNGNMATRAGYAGTLSSGVTRVTSTAETGIPPRYITIAENDDETLAGLPVALHVIRVDDGPFIGDLKVLPGDNVFDERLTIRHSSDFGGDPGPITFQWYYKPIGADFDPTDLPIVDDPDDEFPSDTRGWTLYGTTPASGRGVNFNTIGEGGESGLLTISDNAFICRYKGYAINLDSPDTWSGWVGDPAGTPDQPRAALAEGWVKRVIRGLNPFDARTADFHSAPSQTFASMLIQAGRRYEGPIAFNPSADAINSVGLIEAYTTVLNRARGLSIDGVPSVDFNPANNSILLAASRISDLYMVLGNEAYADAADPTVGFGTGSQEYGSLASSIFNFQNQLDSLLDEELTLLRGRDDSAAGVGAQPVYNRLFWNFSLGDGEVAYQQSYNISDQNTDGFIDERDARILYPQGHGDAWGHYLTATRQYYDLLKHPNFTWIPRTELVSIGGAGVEVDYLDERKFAKAASAKAKAGAEIVNLTYRLNYVDDPAGQWQGYKDTKTDRAWGVTEWARRAGMGAYFDWLAGNTMLPSEDTAHTGLRKIDRQTVRELQEIPLQFDEIQNQLDQADAGLNPLGLAKGVVPFDIDPSLVATTGGVPGKTHYEQVQDRALKAMVNATAVWDEVNKATQALRKNQDSVESYNENVIDQERDYRNRLIEIYGYPHAGEIGAGKLYPSGYNGPDLYHYMYVPVSELSGATASNKPPFTAYFKKMKLGIVNSGDTQAAAFGSKSESFHFPNDFDNNVVSPVDASEVLQVNYPQSAGSYQFATDPSWGQRRAPGEVQMAISDMIQAEAKLRAALKAEDTLLADIQSKADLLNARYQFRATELQLKNELSNTKISLAATIIGATIVQKLTASKAVTALRVGEILADGLPRSVGLANDVSFANRTIIRTVALGTASTLETISGVAGAIAEATEKIGLLVAQSVYDAGFSEASFKYEIEKQVDELERVIHEEAEARLETIRLAEALRQSSGRVQAVLAKGERLIEERVAYRARVAARTTESRYQDMTFRIFRNDALQKYRATFDLAQRYVFLAATAYDYESNLLGTDSRGGRAFLTDIVRQRSLGHMLNGQPVIGRAGLADPLARMGSNFDVLKTQLGFNNPQSETDRFSLRNELFRLRGSSTAAWRSQLASSRVANLWDIPEYRRHCRPFAPETAGAQPGLVIRFPSAVIAGKNFFNWPLGGGDSAYDASRFATKIRSVGVWFTGYNGLGLSQTPRVYLVPAGADVLSSPVANDFTRREWRVVDQAIPVPFPIGANRLTDPAWIPINDSVGGSFAEVRKFSSFRAYHDSGGFNLNEAVSDSRLIGRSVWNTEWMLIIPGQTFLANPNNGLDAFINSVGDIKLFFQTYSYSGN